MFELSSFQIARCSNFGVPRFGSPVPRCMNSGFWCLSFRHFSYSHFEFVNFDFGLFNFRMLNFDVPSVRTSYFPGVCLRIANFRISKLRVSMSECSIFRILIFRIQTYLFKFKLHDQVNLLNCMLNLPFSSYLLNLQC